MTMMVLPGLLTTAAEGAEIALSVRDNDGVQLGGMSLLDGDVVQFEPGSGTAEVLLAEGDFESGSIDVNAVHVRAGGQIVFSTLFNGGIGGVTFGDGDVVEYEPATGGASVVLPESWWTGGSTATDVNAVFLRADGQFVLSHANDSDTLGGLTFTDGDIVLYDPDGDVATLLVAEADLFDDGNGDVDGLHERADGSLLLSFDTDESIGGLNVRDGDIVEYDPATGGATVYFSEATFDSVDLGNDVNALSLLPVCGPDLDGSGAVGFFDLLQVLSAWGTCPDPGDCPADLDGSGDVGITDLLMVIECWGPCP
ncbi:MAG: hypothetical protein KJO43_05065 [Phycisphaerae bacterium]|nr:hypothetical protein [Phycisphaerae bacterium]